MKHDGEVVAGKGCLCVKQLFGVVYYQLPNMELKHVSLHLSGLSLGQCYSRLFLLQTSYVAKCPLSSSFRYFVLAVLLPGCSTFSGYTRFLDFFYTTCQRDRFVKRVRSSGFVCSRSSQQSVQSVVRQRREASLSAGDIITGDHCGGECVETVELEQACHELALVKIQGSPQVDYLFM